MDDPLRTRYIGAGVKYFFDMSVVKFIFICYMNLQLSLLASKETIRLKRRSQAGVKPQLSRSLTDKPAHLVNAVGSSLDIAIMSAINDFSLRRRTTEEAMIVAASMIN